MAAAHAPRARAQHGALGAAGVGLGGAARRLILSPNAFYFIHVTPLLNYIFKVGGVANHVNLQAICTGRQMFVAWMRRRDLKGKRDMQMDVTVDPVCKYQN